MEGLLLCRSSPEQGSRFYVTERAVRVESGPFSRRDHPAPASESRHQPDRGGRLKDLAELVQMLAPRNGSSTDHRGDREAPVAFSCSLRSVTHFPRGDIRVRCDNRGLREDCGVRSSWEPSSPEPVQRQRLRRNSADLLRAPGPGPDLAIPVPGDLLEILRPQLLRPLYVDGLKPLPLDVGDVDLALGLDVVGRVEPAHVRDSAGLGDPSGPFRVLQRRVEAMLTRRRIRPKPAADRMKDERIGEHHPLRLASCCGQLVLEPWHLLFTILAGCTSLAPRPARMRDG